MSILEIKNPSLAKELLKKRRFYQIDQDSTLETRVKEIIRGVQTKGDRALIKYTKKFKAHDENNQAKVGDIVKIMETRPLSKDKRWRLVEIVEEAVII